MGTRFVIPFFAAWVVPVAVTEPILRSTVPPRRGVAGAGHSYHG